MNSKEVNEILNVILLFEIVILWDFFESTIYQLDVQP